MAKIATISQQEFNKLTEEAIKNRPLRKIISLENIKIVDESHISINDITLRIRYNAFIGLLRILKMPVTFIQRFNGLTFLKPEAKRNFINAIKNVINQHSNKNIVLVFSRQNNEVIAVYDAKISLISNTNFIKIVKQIIDSNKLDVVDFSVSEVGDVIINTLNTKSEFNIGSSRQNPLFKEEYFQGGISFSNNHSQGFSISPYVNRLVCANGSIHTDFEESYCLTSVYGESMQTFLNKITEFAKRDFKPNSFVERVKEAIVTKASLFELYKAATMISDVIPKKDAQNLNLEKWVPTKYNEAAYNRIGIDVKKLTAAQLRNAESSITVWQLINNLTEFATHNNGFEINDYGRRVLQVEAGKMLSHNFNMSNRVVSPF